MNAATTTQAQRHITAGCRDEKAEKSKLLSGNICGENKRELKPHAADLLIGGIGIDTRAKSESDDADGCLPCLGLSRSHSNVKFNELDRDEFFRFGFLTYSGKGFWPIQHANGCWADAGNLLRGIIDAVVNFGEGLGNKVLEVHG